MPDENELVLLSEPLLDCEAAAELLNVRVSWVRDATRLGHLPCLRVGRHLRFTRAMLEEWLAVQVGATPGRGVGGTSARAPGAPRARFRRTTQAALIPALSVQDDWRIAVAAESAEEADQHRESDDYPPCDC